MHRFICS